MHQLFSSPQFPGQKPGRRHDNGHLPFPETELPSTGNLPETLEKAVERLRNVYIEQRDALELIKLHDGPETLHFIDPPYLKSTRTREGAYTHEFTDTQHQDLLRLVLDCRGKVVLCGYDNALYNSALSGWCKVSYGARAGMGKKRVECLWMNYPDQLSLFNFHA